MTKLLQELKWLSLFILNVFFKRSQNLGNLKPISSNKQKVFVIGFNKTGTTSVKKALEGLGYKIGCQSIGERLIQNIRKNDYDTLYTYCDTAEAFQDVPFSLPTVYKELHKKYPSAKFILTTGSSSINWYKSILSFHSKKFGKVGANIKLWDIIRARNQFPGWLFITLKLITDNFSYDPVIFQEAYSKHIDQVVDYFGNTSDSLLVLNIEDKNAYKHLCLFLGHNLTSSRLPWENKTESI